MNSRSIYPKAHDKKLMVYVLLSLSLTFLIFVSPAKAQVDVSEIPQRIADSLNAPLFAGQLIMTTIFMAIFMFPTFLLTKNAIAQLFMGVSTMSVCIALGWCPYWLLLLLVLAIAGLYASFMKGILGGKS